MGPFSIPDNKSFWTIMNKKGIYFLSSRRDALSKFKHFTSFKSLKIGKDGKPMIKDLGKFDEGHCAQVYALDEILVVCFGDNRLIMSFLGQTSAFAAKFNNNSNEILNFET